MIELNEKTLVYQKTFQIGSGETDMYGRLRLGALVNLLIQSAIDSSNTLGFGFQDIEYQQLFWVCSRLTLELARPVQWQEQITVETWPKNIERIIYLRDFLLRDKQNKIIAKATSGWLAIDLEHKRPKRIEGISAELFTHLKLKHALKRSPEKLGKIAIGKIVEHRANYFDIDLNKHVTATRYLDWMMDSFSPSFHKQYYPKKMNINYIKETLPFQTICLSEQEMSPNNFLFEGTHKDTNHTSFRGQLIF